MLQSVLYFIITAIIIGPFECHHHHYHMSKLHRRQSQQNLQPPQRTLQPSQQTPQPPQQMLQLQQQTPQPPEQMLQLQQQMPPRYYSLQQPIPQFQIAYPTYPFSSGLNSPPNGEFVYGNPYVASGVQSDNAAVALGNVPVPYRSPDSNIMPRDTAEALPANVAVPLKDPEISKEEPMSTLIDEEQSTFSDFETSTLSYSESDSLMPSYSYPNPVKIGSRRKRKNTGGDTDELKNFFEKGKELLGISTVNYLLIDNGITKLDNDSFDDSDTDNNATLIPLPGGMQLKTDTKNNDSVIHAVVNISSSTQKIVSFDNNTEIENIVEMQMEKKIEDEKGADKGFEAVKIIETERVKPMVHWNASKVHRRRLKNPKKKSFSHHRSKRSEVAPDEALRSKFLYNKMARKFFTAVKRKERVVEPSNLVNRHMAPDFPEINEKTTESLKQQRDRQIYDKNEIDDFMKFFLNEMKKFRKFREYKKNISEPLRRTCDECNSFKLSSREIKKLKKNLSYPKHMNVIMNLNMTFDSKVKDHIAESVKISKAYRTAGLENTTSTARELNSMSEMTTPVHGNEKQNARFLTAVLFLSALTCIFTISTLVLPKLYKLIRLNRMSSAIKTYKLYEDYSRNRDKEVESENLLADDNQQLEWQSEDGDWLSEKESQFK